MEGGWKHPLQLMLRGRRGWCNSRGLQEGERPAGGQGQEWGARAMGSSTFQAGTWGRICRGQQEVLHKGCNGKKGPGEEGVQWENAGSLRRLEGTEEPPTTHLHRRPRLRCTRAPRTGAVLWTEGGEAARRRGRAVGKGAAPVEFPSLWNGGSERGRLERRQGCHAERRGRASGVAALREMRFQGACADLFSPPHLAGGERFLPTKGVRC